MSERERRRPDDERRPKPRIHFKGRPIRPAELQEENGSL